ncbi:hypothetical protein [Geobacillus sp. E263]|uniref:hypothetical protein n=1 Tax=Geobacillus sp. E263 TaxID=391290 RepID=UPI00197AA40C|nr:hypothetical protein [Geobacillus sp. E263]
MIKRIDKALPVFPASDATHGRFRHGQVVYGKIESIQGEAEKIAHVRVGDEMVTARLRASLQAGNYYLFEVKAENDNIYWKIIDGERGLSFNIDEAAQHLIQKWKLPRDAHSFLRFVLQEKIPVAKEEMSKIVQWTEQLEDKEQGWETLRYMFARRFPVTKDVFFSLLAVKTNPPLFQQLQYTEKLLASLPTEQQKDSLQALHRYLQHIATDRKNAYDILSNLLQSLQQPEQKIAQQLLNKLGLPLHNIDSDQLKKFQTAIRNGDFQEIQQHLQLLFPGFEEQQFLKHFQTLYVSYENGFLSNEEQQLFSAILTRSDNDIALSIFHLLKESFQKLGLQYEANIRRALETKTLAMTTLTSLKSLLLQALENAHEPVLKETLQTLLYHITGQQLLSQGEGPLQHVFMQIPIQIGEQRTDVAIHWQGKRQKDGKIDPDYCHIVFCLLLDKLKETVVDVRVQQRIVHISIFNDHPHLLRIANEFQPMLKERLEAHGYTLSALKIETSKQKKMPIDIVFQQRYNGVDYRI